MCYKTGQFYLLLTDIFHKLVTQTQGGNCLETNELLRKILNFLQIETDRLQARVDITGQTEFTHKLLLTTIGDKQYLGDVGFGGKYPSLIEPIPVAENIVFEQGPYQFKLEHQSGLYQLLAKEKKQSSFLKLYSFDLKAHPASDFRDTDGQPKLPRNFSQKHIMSQWKPDETRVWSITIGDPPGLAP